jgi:hypothetical protein
MAVLPGILLVIIIAFIAHNQATKYLADFDNEYKCYETIYGRKHESFFQMCFAVPMNNEFQHQQYNGHSQQKAGETTAKTCQIKLGF